MTKAVRSIPMLISVAPLIAAMPACAQGTVPSATAKIDEKASLAAGQAEAKKVDLPVPPPNFEYAAEGRRDPFVSLVNRGGDQSTRNGAATPKRAEGISGMLTGELTVRGIMQARGAWAAMVAGPDRKVYIVHPGDRLADGVVRQVNAASVVILQEVNDPMWLGKQREVRKFLRGGDEVK